MDEEWEYCKCEFTFWARKKCRNGVMNYGHWCMDCGRWERKSKAEVPPEISLDALPLWNSKKQEKYWAERHEFHARRQEEIQEQNRLAQEERESAYAEYLKTERWQIKRAAVLKRDPICKACGVRKSQQAHHLTYDRIGDEPLFDLIGVCIPCHQKIHNHDHSKCFCMSCVVKRMRGEPLPYADDADVLRRIAQPR